MNDLRKVYGTIQDNLQRTIVIKIFNFIFRLLYLAASPFKHIVFLCLLRLKFCGVYDASFIIQPHIFFRNLADWQAVLSPL